MDKTSIYNKLFSDNPTEAIDFIVPEILEIYGFGYNYGQYMRDTRSGVERQLVCIADDSFTIYYTDEESAWLSDLQDLEDLTYTYCILRDILTSHKDIKVKINLSLLEEWLKTIVWGSWVKYYEVALLIMKAIVLAKNEICTCYHWDDKCAYDC